MNTTRSISLCFTLIFLTLFSPKTEGQKQVPYINSYDSISSGIGYADSGAYVQACAHYETVPDNDTNYALALLEDAIARESLEQDSTAICLCRKGVEQESEYTPDFYNALANVYIDEGNYEDAVTLLRDTVLPIYSNIHKLYYTLGLAQYKMHLYPDAVTSFEKAIDLDFYDAVSHYYLGRCCVEQGRLIPALLSLQFYLTLQPDKNRSYSVVGLIEQLTENRYQYNKSYSADPSEYHDSAFTELDLLIRSKIAMNPQYKSTTNINYTFAKQIQLLLEQLKYVPNTGNYWMEKYVPFYTGLQQKNYLEPYLYFIMASVSANDENLQKGIIKNKKGIEKFAKWADGMLAAERKKKEIEVEGKKITVICNYWDNNMLESMGFDNSAGKHTGIWTNYYRHSGKLYSKGKYNDNGERDGKWQWFYNSGALKETDIYTNGKREDTAKLWYENGALKAIYAFHDDLLNGVCLEYNASGILTSKVYYKDNKLSGTATYFYDDGKRHYTANYINGKFEGELKEYYVTGALKSVKTMQNNLKNGALISYFSNGKVQETSEYKDDQQVGYCKIYYKDGNLRKEGNFNLKGEPEGKWLFYFRNGKKEEVEPFNKNGNIDGIDSSFDKDGLIHEIQLYKDGIVQNYTLLDKNGNIISTGKLDGKTLSMIYYSPDGIKKVEGVYVNNKKEGEWKYYDDCGNLATAENLYNGDLYGESIDYYTNGKVKDSVYYTDGKKDGYWVSYFVNGQMNNQGWYADGNKQGDWYYYDLKGALIKHDFFTNGTIHGHIDYFAHNGILSEQKYYRYGYLDKIIDYDSTGSRVCYTYKSDKGNGKYKYPYNNGKINHELNYINGLPDGAEKRYSYNGQLTKDGYYLLGECEDTLKTYYENGKPQYLYCYNFGDREGICTSYYKNGNIEKTAPYSYDELDGEQIHYYDNGKLYSKTPFENGKIEGEYKEYYGDSIIKGFFWYLDGKVTAYSYLNKNSIPVPPITLDKGTGDITCYYSNGKRSIQCSYKYGELTGKNLVYSPDGKLLMERNYESGHRNGIEKQYNYGDTTLKEMSNYYYGELDGPCTFYYPNGKLEHVEFYSLGKKEGKWRYYDKDGFLIKTSSYFNGNEVAETAVK